MKKLTHSFLIRVFLGITMTAGLVATSAAATTVGESAGDVWVDGPLDVKLGDDPEVPHAAVDHRGRSIYVWQETLDDTRADILVRIFDADGSSLVDPVKINTYADDLQRLPRVAVSADGSFLVVWESGEEPSPGAGFERQIVLSQAFDAAGGRAGFEYLADRLPTRYWT